MNILVVDDNNEGRYMLKTLLTGSGYEVLAAENGIEALDILKRNAINIIISDILMPKMDGFAFCRECKKDEILRRIPFIFYTATYTDKKDEEFALSLGAEKFIVKPTEPSQFLEILEGVIKEHKEKAVFTVKKPAEEEVFLAEYNKRLVEKLECKAMNLEKELASRRIAEQKLREEQERLRALAAELSLAEERERRRIADGLHNEIAQQITMVRFRLQSLMASVSDKNMRAALDRESNLMSDILDDIRTLTFDLSNPVLYEIGLKTALKNWLMSEIQKKAGLKCEFRYEGNKEKMNEDIEVILFQAAREILTNVVKHARASVVKTDIVKGDTDVRITIKDNGIGFDTSKLGLPNSISGGFGLFSIRQRLEYMGGSLEIDSGTGAGTCIVMTVPLKK